MVKTGLPRSWRAHEPALTRGVARAPVIRIGTDFFRDILVPYV